MVVTDVDDDDDDDMGTVIIALMQKGRRKLLQEGQKNFTIGYEIYEVCTHFTIVIVDKILQSCGNYLL